MKKIALISAAVWACCTAFGANPVIRVQGLEQMEHRK